MAFSTSSAGVGCSFETGASSSFFCSSASVVAHLRWYCSVDETGLERNRDEDDSEVMLRGLYARDEGDEERTRKALRRRESLQWLVGMLEQVEHNLHDVRG